MKLAITSFPMTTTELFQILGLWSSKYLESAMRGALILTPLFLVFWVFKRPWMDKYRVQPGTHKAKPALEIFYALSNTYVVYAMISVTLFLVYKATGHSMMYKDIAAYGWPYAIASFFIILFVYDTSFYWAHTLMHKYRALYRVTHATHHKFINVTPFAAYAFHVGEAGIAAATLVVMLLVIPWHPMAFLSYVVFSIAYNGLLHLGYDLFPKSWRGNKLLKWMNTTTHHIYHHQQPNCNYGFVTTCWDKWMKTERLPENYYRQN
jgi:Delta7-sterol 5-desaturase